MWVSAADAGLQTQSAAGYTLAGKRVRQGQSRLRKAAPKLNLVAIEQVFIGWARPSRLIIRCPKHQDREP